MRNGNLKRAVDPGPMPAPKTFCKHCNAAFPMALPILGQDPGIEFYQLTANLALHLNQAHLKEIQQDALAQMACTIAYSSQRVIRHFSSTDTGLLTWCDTERHKVFRAVSKPPMPDERIEQKVAELFDLAARREEGPGTPSMEEVILLVKSMRDALEERNLYPGQP
jgi:hypothetical protein